jgi:hypothetical protein
LPLRLVLNLSLFFLLCPLLLELGQLGDRSLQRALAGRLVAMQERARPAAVEKSALARLSYVGRVDRVELRLAGVQHGFLKPPRSGRTTVLLALKNQTFRRSSGGAPCATIEEAGRSTH